MSIKLEELRRKPHLSASSILDYINCSFSYRLGRVDGCKPEFTPDALEFGSVIHQCLGDFYAARKIGYKLPKDELLYVFEHYWESAAYGREDIRYKDGDSYETLQIKGKEILAAFYENLPSDDLKVLAIENPFSFRVEGVSVPIIGATDLIEWDGVETIIITDWKTSGKSYSADDIDNSFQLAVYHLATKANDFKNCEILLKFDVLVKTKTAKFEQHYTVINEAQERKTISTIKLAWEGIQKGTYLPTGESWRCKGCVFKTACDKELGR
jgi:putative RecB family exonuclease